MDVADEDERFNQVWPWLWWYTLDQPNNESSCQKIETIQYSAALAITSAIKSISQVKLYNELGLQSLEFRQWFRKLCLFFMIKKTGITEYLKATISHLRMLPHFITEKMYSNILIFYILFKNGTNKKIRIFLSFKTSLLEIGQPTAKPTYNPIHNPTGLKFLTWIRLGLSHLNKHKFKQNFQDC